MAATAEIPAMARMTGPLLMCVFIPDRYRAKRSID